jgi:Ca2+-binding EF-hand superfamily protein
VLGELLGRIAAAFIDRKAQKLEDRFLARSMTLSDLEVMDTNKDGEVSEAEFLTYMLVALQKVEQEDIDQIKSLFQKLDKSQTGAINKQDLSNLADMHMVV